MRMVGALAALLLGAVGCERPRNSELAGRISGRVVDAQGEPVTGARVVLNYSFAPEPPLPGGTAPDGFEPLLAETDASGEYAFNYESHPRLEALLGDVERHAQVFPGSRHALSVRATKATLASWKSIIDWMGADVRVPDLAVTAGATSRVVVRWSDGEPGAGVPVDVMLDGMHSTLEDERASLLSFDGVTDAEGILAFGPVPDCKLRVIVNAAPAGAPPQSEWWDSRLRRPDGFELILARGRTVRGRLLTADGRPAAGYRVVPLDNPEVERSVTTDADGNFAVPGVDPHDGAIAVHERPKRPSRELHQHLEFIMDGVGHLTNPLLIHRVPAGRNDVGTISLPRLGTLSLRLEDALGNGPESGHAFWWRAGERHGSRSVPADAARVIRFQRIPLEIAIEVDVTIQDARHGELRQRFDIAEVKEESIPLRVTGAGTIIVRLHPKGAPDKPLEAMNVSAQWHDHHGLGIMDGPVSEVRGWEKPGRYRELRIRALGFREHVVKNVVVSDDGPTFVDVELEPR